MGAGSTGPETPETSAGGQDSYDSYPWSFCPQSNGGGFRHDRVRQSGSVLLSPNPLAWQNEAMETNPFRKFRFLETMDRRFQRRYATAVMLAESLEPRGGARLSAIWLLCPKINVKVDERLVLRVFKSLAPTDRLELVRFPEIVRLRLPAFREAISLLQQAMLACPNEMTSRHVEDFARILFLTAQHRPKDLVHIDADVFTRLVRAHQSRHIADSLYSTGMQTVFGRDVKRNVRRMLTRHNDPSAVDLMADIANIPFQDNKLYMDLIKGDSRGKPVLAKIRWIRTQAARYLSRLQPAHK